MSALQGGRRRRPRSALPRSRGPALENARRRWFAAVLALVALIALCVSLGLMAARAGGPARVALRFTKPKPPVPVRSSYGELPAPPWEHVNVRLRLGLSSGLLFDVRTGQVLWELRPGRVLPIASLTKMMTALVVAAHSRPSDKVLITPAAVHFTGSGIGLLPLHKRVSELALLYGLMLPSGNDAAIALAQHVAGTQGGLIAMMNARARQLGLSCTHFTTVSGIVDQGNHSCVADLALMAHEVLEQPLLGRIVGTRNAILPFPIKGGKLYLFNNNPLMIERYPGIDGVKTGLTNAAGQCLIATARRGRTWLGVVLLHSADTIDQAQRLLNAGFQKARA